jgi:hypothetical protein
MTFEQYKTHKDDSVKDDDVWTKEDGTKVFIPDMSYDHLKNSIKMIERKYEEVEEQYGPNLAISLDQNLKYKRLKKELKRRIIKELIK